MAITRTVTWQFVLRYKHTGNSEAVSIINDIRLRLSKAKNGLNGLPYMLIVSVAKNPSNPLKPLNIYNSSFGS